jgi:hypothetical protein
LGVHVDDATGVHPVGHAGPESGWQLPVAGSQHTADGPHGLLGVQAVHAGCTAPPACEQKVGSARKQRPQQQQASVGPLHTGLGLQGVCARKKPPTVLQKFAVVELHPPGRQHAPKTVAELQTVGLHAVPGPCGSPPSCAQVHGSSCVHTPLGWQHASFTHGDEGHGFGEQVVDVTCVQPPGHGTIIWQLPVAGSQHTPVGAPHEVGVHDVPPTGVPPPETHNRTTAITQLPLQQQGVSVKLVPHAACTQVWLGMNVPPANRHEFCDAV